MSFMGTIADALGGNIVGTVVDTVKAYFPPSMTDQEKAELSLKIADAENKKNLVILTAANAADAEFNSRIKEMEGTAGDLKTIPVIGHIVIFARGIQRPVWGFFALWADYNVFSGVWKLNEQQDSMLFAINFLVLGFLFGERAAKNVMPLIGAYFGKGKQ